jgi:glycosyltransferase involved in cell wall biosynthesis
VLEAMAHGKPAFLSRLTSLPEIGGEAAFYFDSFEPSAMALTIREGLDAVAKDPSSADRFRRHASQFSWSDTARLYWELFATVARG